MFIETLGYILKDYFHERFYKYMNEFEGAELSGADADADADTDEKKKIFFVLIQNIKKKF